MMNPLVPQIWGDRISVRARQVSPVRVEMTAGNSISDILRWCARFERCLALDQVHYHLT